VTGVYEREKYRRGSKNDCLREKKIEEEQKMLMKVSTNAVNMTTFRDQQITAQLK
jgi:hypothetical protein